MKRILPFVILVFSLIGCSVKATELIDGDKHLTDEMHDVISKHIVEKYSAIHNDTEVQFEVHKVYGTSERDGVISVYMWSYFGGFNKSTGIEHHRGHSLPAVIRLKREIRGYSVIEYIEPQDGSFFQSSLKKMFPEKYLKSVHSDTGNIEELQTKMDKKVDEWLKGN